MATRMDLRIEQFSTFSVTTLYTDPSTGSPVNLSGYSADLHVRRTPGSDTLLLEATTESGEIVLGADGTVTVTISAADTGEMPAGRWRYDLVVEAPGGARTRILEGLAIVAAGVTQLP